MFFRLCCRDWASRYRKWLRAACFVLRQLNEDLAKFCSSSFCCTYLFNVLYSNFLRQNRVIFCIGLPGNQDSYVTQSNTWLSLVSISSQQRPGWWGHEVQRYANLCKKNIVWLYYGCGCSEHRNLMFYIYQYSQWELNI